MPTPPPSPAFVLGVPRSGTTLLRVMLEGHPQLFSPPEMILAPFETMEQRRSRLEQRFWEKGGLRRALMELQGLDVDGAKSAESDLLGKTIPEVYAYLQERLGQRILVDKCPHLCAEPEALARLGTWYPEARYIWIVRHPGSVIRSIENMPYAEVMLQGYADDPRDIWWAGNTVVQRFLEGIPAERWTRIRYEDLVTEPRPVVEQMCRTLGVDFHEAMLDPYQGERMREGPKGARPVGDPNMATRGRIQPELADKWLEGFDPRRVSDDTRAMARDFGYDLDALPLPPIADVGNNLERLLRAAIDIEANMNVPMDIDAVEGRRFLTRMLAASLETFTEQSDSDRPRFFHAEGPSRKMFADCPDADYWRAPIDLRNGAAYRVRGRLPTGTLYIGVVLYRRGGVVGRFLPGDQVQVDGEGRFDLVVATADPGVTGQWVQGDGDETALIVRQYFTDRTTQAPIELSIERLGKVPRPEPLDAAAMAKQLERAERMLRSVFERTVSTYRLARVAALNRFIEVPGEQLFPTPDNTYRVCWYRIGSDQVMLVRGRLPTTRYFGVCLYNAWMESFDYLRHRIGRNHTQIETGPEGAYELCIAHRDPGHPNWIDTAGHNAGYILMRALLAEGTWPDIETEILYEHEYATRG